MANISYLAPVKLPELQWDAENAANSLQAVYAHVVGDAQAATDWYEGARKPKKYGGLIIRIAAVVLVSTAGLLPILNSLLNGDQAPSQGNFLLKPLTASFAIGLAAALVGFDKYFGFSTGWMRFVTTAMQIRAAMEAFEMDWTCLRASWHGQTPTGDQVDGALAKCKEFAGTLNKLVADETNQWVQEFQASLKQVDDAVSAAQTEAQKRADAEKARVEAAKAEEQKRLEAAKPGALNLTVANTDKAGGKFSVQVGSGAVLQFVGGTAAIPNVAPGLQKVRVFAVIDGSEHAQERIVTVSAGAITAESFTL
jgi:hypothetical protein